MYYNRNILLVLAGFCCLGARGQQEPLPELLYIGKLPLYFYHNTQGLAMIDSFLLQVPPGKLGIKPGYIPFNLTARSIHIDRGQPIHPYTGALKIQLSTINRIIKPWGIFCNHESASDCEKAGADFDWHIEPDSVYQVHIATFSGDSMLLGLTVQCVNEQPSLMGWRTLQEYDGLSHSSNPVLLEKMKPEKLFNPPAPVIRPGSEKYIQFRFKPPVPSGQTH